ncbi:CHASE3 domain-containing protein [Sphingomonas sp. MMS12-HWE2-04]|uniref:CHASE3 domain-containing protein n=1 Tax=Sphingomonas sp. MMS12-HWE2-04 TaxID=3234199 RepID=UPI00384AB411
MALVLSFALLAAALLGTLVLFQGQQRADRWVGHTFQVQEQLSRVLSRLQDAETGQRGFLVTANRAFLRPYEDGTRNLSRDLAALFALVSDNPNQAAAAIRLDACARERVARLGVGIRLVEAGKRSEAGQMTQFGTGNAVMERCRAIVVAMKDAEGRLLDARVAAAAWQARLFTIWVVMSAIAIAVVAYFVTRAAHLRTAHVAEARDALARANAQLLQEGESRTAAEAQVRQLQKMDSLGKLTGGIAHDFNNMLAIVIGSLDLARRRLHEDASRAGQHIESAMEGARRAARLTAQLLAFGRRQALAPTAVDASALVRRMSELLRRTIGGDIEFAVRPAPGLWPSFVDASQLESTLVNLCVNARDAMPEGGRLTLATANMHLGDQGEVPPGDYVRITVQDTGHGMPREVADRAFEPFFTTKETGKGSGLGLSQVYGFVRQSGGHVALLSEPGHGTTVQLYLPRYTGSAKPEVWTPASERQLEHARGSEIVLVVDDEVQVRALAVDALRELGYVAMDAEDPDAALETLATHARIDLLLTDVLMPGMTGRQLAAMARKRRPELKLLFMSGNPADILGEGGGVADDLPVLPKPFTMAELGARVRSALDAGVVPVA